jgi:hypothetical protein
MMEFLWTCDVQLAGPAMRQHWRRDGARQRRADYWPYQMTNTFTRAMRLSRPDYNASPTAHAFSGSIYAGAANAGATGLLVIPLYPLNFLQ